MIVDSGFRSGHIHDKSYGDTLYRGRLAHLPEPQPLASAEAGARAMHTDGFVQFPDVLSAQSVRDLRAWMDALGGGDAQYDVPNWCFNKHLRADFHNEPRWLDLIDPDPIVQVLELVLGSGFSVTGGGFWITGPGREMNIHLDQIALSLPEDVLADPRVQVPVWTSSLHYYLDDQVEEIGPTLVIPGSHRAGRPPENESTWHGIEPRMVSVRAGGAMLFRHEIWHGAARNTSSRRRYLIQVHYHDARRGTIQPPITQTDCWSPRVLARATQRQRHLLGGAPVHSDYR